MLVSQLANRTGASARSIRHYDRAGLLPSVRGSNGYREFPVEAVERVERIRALLDIGLNLDEVRRLLPCFVADGRLGNCAELRSALDEHIGRVDEQIARLRSTRGLLTATATKLVG